MANKKNIRKDGTYLISQDSTDNPKLGAKVLKNGKESLYLDYYRGVVEVYDTETSTIKKRKDRHRKFLNLYLWSNPRTQQERQENAETLQLAKNLRYEQQKKRLQVGKGYVFELDKQVNYLDYMSVYIDNHTKKNKRIYIMMFKDFKAFLQSTPKYSIYLNYLLPQNVTKEMVKAFADYLLQHHKPSGAKTTYQTFKSIILQAVEDEVIKKNVCRGVSIYVDNQQINKAILSVEEMRKMVATHYEGENKEIRRAFYFSYCTGTRFCDVKDITFASVDYSNNMLIFEQNKTKGHSGGSGVARALTEELLKIIGQPVTDEPSTELIFKLPHQATCLKALEKWRKISGITKHITWHCARHSFATNMLGANVPLITTSKLLGHRSITMTQRYTHVVNEDLDNAIKKTPKLGV